MLTLIIGRGKSGKTDLLLEKVKNCPAETMAGRILLVPEQMGHMMERRLSRICGDEISYVSEVLSLDRLYNRVCALSGGAALQTLDQTGRILTAKAALEAIRHRLKVFASAAARPEFLTAMVNLIDEMKSYDVTPQILRDTAAALEGMFAEKLSELALILEAYDAAIATGVFDPRDVLTLLRKKLREGDYAGDRYFFIDGFTDYSQQEMGVLRELLIKCREMTVTVPCDDIYGEDPLFDPGRKTALKLMKLAEECGTTLQIVTADHTRQLPRDLTYLEKSLFDYSAQPFSGESSSVSAWAVADMLSECRRCGAVIKQQAMAGKRYRDMMICTEDQGVYGPMLETVFSSMGIPLYRSAKRSILSHSAVAFVLLALEAAADHMETQTVTAYLKTGYGSVDANACDAIENYAYVWRIRGSKWLSPWTMHPDGYDGKLTPQIRTELQTLNACKDAAIAPLVHLRNGLRAAENVEAMMLCLYQFLEETRLFETLSREVEASVSAGNLEQAQETAQIYGILLECLRQINAVLGKAALKSDELLRVVRLALGQYSVGTIPSVLDAVTFGGLDHVRGQEPRLLYVLGANEGKLPMVPAGGSLLSERERNVLRDDYHIELAPDVEGAMERQLLKIYGVLTTPLEKLYISWCTEDGGEQLSPSFLVTRILKLLPGAEEYAALETEYTPALAAEHYLMNDGTPEKAALAEAIHRASQEITALAEAIARGKAGSLPRDEHVDQASAEKLFGNPVSLTASRLDQLWKCPLSFYLNYGLKAKVRKEADFDASEFGTFVHYILEKTVQELAAQEEITPIERDKSTQMVARYLEAYARERFEGEERTARQDYLFERNGQEAAALLEDVAQELSVSDFKPVAFELQFGGDGDLSAVEVQGKLGYGRLTGFVDRADLWESSQGNYLRVVDYKSGSKKFDFTDLYGGVGMQMLLYLFAMESGSEKPLVPAGVLYMPAKIPFVSMDPDEAEDQKARKRSGVVLGEQHVLEAMEHGEKFRYLPVKNGKTGPGDQAISRQQMDALKEFVSGKMSQAVDKVLSGEFRAEPFYRGMTHDPCRYCDYSQVCQKDPEFRRKHYHEDITPGAFWEKIGGEELE